MHRMHSLASYCCLLDILLTSEYVGYYGKLHAEYESDPGSERESYGYRKLTQENEAGNRIINGYNSDIVEHPWTVQVQLSIKQM